MTPREEIIEFFKYSYQCAATPELRNVAAFLIDIYSNMDDAEYSREQLAMGSTMLAFDPEIGPEQTVDDLYQEAEADFERVATGGDEEE